MHLYIGTPPILVDSTRKTHLTIICSLTAVVFVTYLTTMAHGLILGDPTEYTFVAHVLGIAHPPGYVFITLLGKLMQIIVPAGTIAWRTHLLSVLVGTGAAVLVYGSVRTVENEMRPWLRTAAAMLAALTLAWGTNQWQHAIHTNPHLITGTFLLLNLFLLIRWHHTQNDRYLYAFSLSAGLGATHHPLTVFSFPAYTVFILLVRPRILTHGRTLLKMVGWALLGLSLFVYYPLRSSMGPAVGPNTMNTLEGFLAHVLARGLSNSLPYYTLPEQPLRALVFLSILRLQYGWMVLFTAVFGFASLWRKQTRTAVLYTLAFGINYAFVISLKQQDIMAYLIGPIALVAVWFGHGAAALGGRLAARRPERWIPATAVAALFLAGPIAQLWFNYPRISLQNFDEGDRHVAHTFTYFDGRVDRPVLLNNWEFMTPLWYTQLVEKRWPDPAEVRPEFVSAAEPWLPSVFNYLPGGPVYLNSYRREIVDAGFRLRPRGPFYQVVEPGDESVPPDLTMLNVEGDGIELVAYEQPAPQVTAGEFVSLTLAMRVPVTTTDYYAPVLRVGEIDYPFTTDTHLITPLWEADEVIVERFDFALPHDLPAGEYRLSVGMRNLSQNADADIRADLGTLRVNAHPSPPPTADLLANFRQRVGLPSAVAVHDWQTYTAPWSEPITAVRGDTITVIPTWRVLDYAEESYTIFVHLIDPANRLYIALDYTPLGGATPTHLWFPKWLPDQTMRDPYRMVLPPDLPTGDYLIEVGLYEMTSGRRLHMHDQAGNLVGDRYILGSVTIEE